MTVYNNEVDASSLGGSSTCAYFKGGINMNANVTLTACKFTSEIDNDTSKTLTLNYCTLNDTSPQDFALGEQNFTATRSQMMGSSDGVRFGGNVNLIEDYIRTKLQSPDDHNDGVQAYLAGSGGSILRCNINVTPVNGDNSTTTGAIFMADDSQGTAEIRDNYLIGGGYTLRLHENMFYRVTGNIIEKNSYAYGPLSTDNSRSGAFLEWSNNKLSDGTALNP